MSSPWPPPGRIVGLDVTRGLAVLGMIAAHVLVTDPFDWGRPETWASIVDGRSATVFSMLAGVSIGIISGGERAVPGLELRLARIRIAVRAALIFVLGGLLILLDTPVAVILPYYAVLFLMSLPVLRWPARRLFLAAFATALIGPVLVAMVRAAVVAEQVLDLGLPQLLATGSYPALIWLAYVLAGLGIARAALHSRVRQLRLLMAAMAVSALGYSLGALSMSWAAVPADGDAIADAASAAEPGWWQLVIEPGQYLGAAPHSGTPFELLGNGGFAAALIAALLLLGPALHTPAVRLATLPIAATGAMALTAYSAHIAVFFLIDLATGAGLAFEQPMIALLLVAGGVVVACTLWTLLLGRGPLERLLTALSHGAARSYRAARVTGGELD